MLSGLPLTSFLSPHPSDVDMCISEVCAYQNFFAELGFSARLMLVGFHSYPSLGPVCLEAVFVRPNKITQAEQEHNYALYSLQRLTQAVWPVMPQRALRLALSADTGCARVGVPGSAVLVVPPLPEACQSPTLTVLQGLHTNQQF